MESDRINRTEGTPLWVEGVLESPDGVSWKGPSAGAGVGCSKPRLPRERVWLPVVTRCLF